MSKAEKSNVGVTKNLDSILTDKARKILEVRKIMKKREEARANEDFHASDVIRDELKVLGVIVLDQKSGPSGWKFANGQSKKLPSGISIPEDSAKKRKREPDGAAATGKSSKDAPVLSKKKTKDQNRNLAVLQAMMGAAEENNQNVVKGVRIEEMAGGHGRAAAHGDKIKVHYMGRLQGANGKEGKIFDCSSKKPFAFRLGKGDVIQGWDIGVVGMQVGSKRKLTIPPERAYGRNGAPPKIPGNATLIFEVPGPMKSSSRNLLRRAVTYTLSDFPASVISRSSSGGRKSVALDKSSSLKHASALDTNPPKGTRDFLPEEYRLQTWLFGLWRSAARGHGFEEYDAPVVEQAQLYTRKSGEEISQQLYTFEDKGGRQLCLRPEMTPSLARMVLKKGKALPLPIKWFSLPQCWRYEKMSKGRRREHYQWNMDVWGVKGVEAEAEVLSALVSSLRAMGLTANDVGIRINSKDMVTAILDKFDISADYHPAVCIIIDKWDKLPLHVIQEELQKVLVNVAPARIEDLLQAFNLKEIKDIEALLGPENRGIADMSRMFSLAEKYGYCDWLVFDATIVRGLSYYTGIVFEVFDRKGKFRAICGGGRYDHLLNSFTAASKPASIPAVGFGFGDAVIIELLKSKNLLPDVAKQAVVDVVVCRLEDDDCSDEDHDRLLTLSIQAATDLRDRGLSVDLVLEKKRAKWMFQRADKLNAVCTLMFASAEISGDGVVLKDMKKGSQAIIKHSNIVEEVSNLLSSL